MEPVFLSDIELFYTERATREKFVLTDEEAKHASKVLRKKVGDTIYATNGKGNIFKGKIVSEDKKNVTAEIIEKTERKPEFPNIVFYIPLLKNKDRMRFAFEKLVELGFTQIVFYKSKRAIPKNFNSEKWEKISIAAIKQSLRANLPEISFLPKLVNFNKSKNLKTVLLDQNGKIATEDLIRKIVPDENYAFFIGPEGSFTEKEKEIINPDFTVKLSDFRLRSETAVISVASVISLLRPNN